jgi:hypothetical protein
MPPVRDEHHGNSGSYIVGEDGKRQLVEGSQTKPHPEGDAPRDEHGERTDRGPDHVASATPQPAVPAPVAPPWATPPAHEAQAPAAGETTPRRSRRSE